MTRRRSIVLLGLAVLLGCGEEGMSPQGPKEPLNISLLQDTLDLFVGEAWALSYRTTSASGEPVEVPVAWTTSDPEVAVVSAVGTVTGVGRGAAEIRADVAGGHGALVVRVAEPLSLLPPIDGVVGADHFMNHYVAHTDAFGEPVDFHCGPKAPREHEGTDFALTDFETMRKKVPVLAASSGIVTSIRDGEPSFSIHVDPDTPPNQVVVDHGEGRRTIYENLWAGTLGVTVGDTVAAGAQLGLVGSSGASWIPHLHFEVRLHHRVIDPFAGPCSTSVDHWAETPRYEDEFRVMRTRVSDYQLLTAPHLAVDVPKAADTIFAGRDFVAWIQELNAEVHSRSRIRILDAEGRVRRDSHQIRLAGPVGLTWFGVRVSTADEAASGTWTMEYSYDGSLVRRLTFEMVVPQVGVAYPSSSSTMSPMSDVEIPLRASNDVTRPLWRSRATAPSTF